MERCLQSPKEKLLPQLKILYPTGSSTGCFRLTKSFFFFFIPSILYQEVTGCTPLKIGSRQEKTGSNKFSKLELETQERSKGYLLDS